MVRTPDAPAAGTPARRALPVLATGALVTALAACGGVSTGGDEPSGSGEAPSSITTMGFGLPDEIASVRVETYEEASGVDVEVVEGDFDEQQFLSAVASGDVPDVVYLNRDVVGTYAARGAIQPMDDCVEQQEVDMSAFRAPAVEQVTIDGSVYGLPEFFAVRVVIADTDALGQAGLTVDQVATGDWDAIAAANQAMSQRQGSTLQRIGYDPRLPETLPLWAAANGGALLSDDGRTAQLDSPEVVEALEATSAMVDAAGGWSSVSAFRDSWDFFGEQNEYAVDQVGAMPMESWYVNQLSEVGTPGWTVAPFLDREGEPLTWATGQAWAIPAGAEHPEAACEFGATMTATQTWLDAATARAEALRGEGGEYTGTFTGNVEADEQIFAEVYQPVSDPALDEAISTIVDLQDDARSMPPSPAAAEVDDAYRDAVVRVLNGEQDAATALAQAQETAQRAIDEAAGD